MNNMINEYLIIYILLTSVIWAIICFFYKKRYKDFESTFLDSVNNISIILNSKKVINMNKRGLTFFGVSSVENFNNSYPSISYLFIEEMGCLGKHTLGRDWLKNIDIKKNDTFKVKLLNREDKEFYYFDIKISKIPFSNEFLIIFNDITTIINEKNRAERDAVQDALTGIYNRVKLNKILPDFIFGANKYDKYFSVILFDIDHFKNVNDTYGHSVGDSVLKELTHTIKNSLRDSDMFVRWGGEEFLILLYITHLDDALKLASRLRKSVEERPFLHVGNITCSFGVTEFRAGDTDTILLNRVDEALYEAKNSGRNRVVQK